MPKLPVSAKTKQIRQLLSLTAGAPIPQGPAGQMDSEGHAYYLTGETRRLSRDKVTPEYAALLTVCSRYLWVSPYMLHAEVAQLEYEMAEVEVMAATST